MFRGAVPAGEREAPDDAAQDTTCAGERVRRWACHNAPVVHRNLYVASQQAAAATIRLRLDLVRGDRQGGGDIATDAGCDGNSSLRSCDLSFDHFDAAEL